MKEGSGTFITWVIGFSVNFFSVHVNFASHLPPSVSENTSMAKPYESTSKHLSHVDTSYM